MVSPRYWCGQSRVVPAARRGLPELTTKHEQVMSVNAFHRRPSARTRIAVNSVMTSLTAACAIFAIVILILILGYIAIRGVSSLSIPFLIETPKPVGEGGGIGNAIV